MCVNNKSNEGNVEEEEEMGRGSGVCGEEHQNNTQSNPNPPHLLLLLSPPTAPHTCPILLSSLFWPNQQVFAVWEMGNVMRKWGGNEVCESKCVQMHVDVCLQTPF